MITIISLPDFSALLDDAVKNPELECTECAGTGECPCCERGCLVCGGAGYQLKTLSDS